MKATTLAAAALYAVASGLAYAQTAADVQVVAVVNGEEILGSDVSAMYRDLPQQFRQMPIERLFPQIVENLIGRKLVAQAARAAGLMDDPEVAARLQRGEDIVLQEIFLFRRVEAEVDDARLRAAYQQIAASWPAEEEVRASHILLATEEDAAAVVDALVAGADFAALARERSTGPSAPSGGDLGYIQRGQMVPSFTEAAFALATGEFTAAPVQTQFGWHVIIVVDRRVSQPPSFEESLDALRQQETQGLVQGIIADLRANAEVEIRAPDGSRIEEAP